MKIVAGVDEVGRGSLIGPVFAAAVILNKSINKKILRDSKSLTKSKRENLSRYIKKNSIWSVGKASVKEIEKINILQDHLPRLTVGYTITQRASDSHKVGTSSCFTRNRRFAGSRYLVWLSAASGHLTVTSA